MIRRWFFAVWNWNKWSSTKVYQKIQRVVIGRSKLIKMLKYKLFMDSMLI